MKTTSPKGRKIHEQLEARRSALLARYKDTVDRADEEQLQSSELVDSANDQWDVRVLSSMSETDAVALEHVIAAMTRLDNGTYGKCAACGEPIAAARLHILPEAAECAACATFAEVQQPRWISEVS